MSTWRSISASRYDVGSVWPASLTYDLMLRDYAAITIPIVWRVQGASLGTSAVFVDVISIYVCTPKNWEDDDSLDELTLQFGFLFNASHTGPTGADFRISGTGGPGPTVTLAAGTTDNIFLTWTTTDLDLPSSLPATLTVQAQTAGASSAGGNTASIISGDETNRAPLSYMRVLFT